MGTFSDLAELFAAGWGWVFVLLVTIYGLLWITWQLYAPKLLDRDTALAPIVRDVPDKVDELSEEQEQLSDDVGNVKSQVEEVQSRQKIQMQVQRAQSRANPQMDEHRVDEYLVQNGVEPDEFLRGDEMTGYENWEADDDDN